tara:strand:+ start:6498 stop:7022 length:525 start_codon:yes stop_codon:yes gene_type:complete
MTSNLAAWPAFPGDVSKTVSVNTNAELQAITSCTFDTWVKFTAINTPAGNHGVVGKWAQLGGIYITGSGWLYAYDPNAATGRAIVGGTSAGVWYHLSMSCTNGAPGSCTMHVNGQATTPVEWTAGGTLTWPLLVGSMPGFWPLNGLVDEARLYSRALSLDEVKRNYYAGLGRHS